MKFSFYIGWLHLLFAIVNILCMFLLDYHYLNYTILISSLILLGWVLNKDCILVEYEKFIECTYDKVEDKCDVLNKTNHKLQFHIDLWHHDWILLIIGISISLIRYRYQYNFFSLSRSRILNSILIGIFMICINLLFFLLFIPAVKYYNEYKNKKQLLMYITYFLVCIACSVNYLFIQEHHI